MPKFLYTIILISIGLWFFAGKMFFGTPPESTFVVLQFLFLIGLAVTFTFSIPVYLFLVRKNPNFTNLRFLYRKAFKWGVFLGSLISMFLGLRAFGLASTLNLALLGIVYAMIFVQFRRSR